MGYICMVNRIIYRNVNRKNFYTLRTFKMIEKGIKFNVLNDGFIQVIDWLGTDESICQAARTSYQKGTKSVSDDRTLIRYLMRHAHTSPIEFAQLILYIRIPIDCDRQFVRHRMASRNEYSTRYSEAIDSMEKTKPDAWRLQSGSNKQGSSGLLTEWPKDIFKPSENYYKTPGEYLSDKEISLHTISKDIYEQRLEFGIAREQARKDLPLSNYTEYFWSIDLHNLLHFLKLRMDSHAQLEIRSYANIIGNEIVNQLWPLTWEAFCDYKLNSITLTALEIKYFNNLKIPLEEIITNKRERDEAIEKFKLLGLQ